MDTFEKYYKMLVELNSKNKLKYLKVLKIVGSNKCLYLCDMAENKQYKITNIDTIYSVLKNECYITNISLLRKYISYVTKYYLNREDWHNVVIPRIKDNRNLKGLNIIKVDDLNSYLTKFVLVQKGTVLYSDSFFYLLYKDNNIYLVSDLNLVVNNNTWLTFTDMPQLKIIRIENLNIADKDNGYLKDLSYVFDDCRNLETLVLKNFNTKYIKTFFCTFRGCVNLKNINLTNIDTSSATDLSYMFRGCENLVVKGIENWDVRKVRTFNRMFFNCSSIKTLNLQNWVLGNDVDLSGMFMLCNNLKELYLDNWFSLYTFNDNYNIKYIFFGCKKLDSMHYVKTLFVNTKQDYAGR